MLFCGCGTFLSLGLVKKSLKLVSLSSKCILSRALLCIDCSWQFKIKGYISQNTNYLVVLRF